MRVTPHTLCLCGAPASEHPNVDRGTYIGRGPHPNPARNCQNFRPFPGQPRPAGSRRQPHGINRFPSHHLDTET